MKNPFEKCFDFPSKSQETYSLPKAIIIDMDGTLAINPEGLKYNPYQSLYDVEKSLDYIENKAVKKIVDTYPHTKIIVTARNNGYHSRLLTTQWLQDHNIKYKILYMRNLNNFDKDYVYKAWVYEKFIKDSYNVEFSLEDKDSCRAMYQDFGIHCPSFGIEI